MKTTAHQGINIGAGNAPMINAMNMDIGDDVQLSGFQDNTIPWIYTSHFLEYFDDAAAMQLLQGWNRVLIPGGRIHIAVPDFAALAEIYQETGVIYVGPLFGKLTNNKSQPMYHKTVFDFRRLRDMLLMAGFAAVKKFKSFHDDCSNSTIDGKAISLNLTAIKPY